VRNGGRDKRKVSQISQDSTTVWSIFINPFITEHKPLNFPGHKIEISDKNVITQEIITENTSCSFLLPLTIQDSAKSSFSV